MSELSKLDTHVLEKQSSSELAKWWTQLNTYEWPAEMPRPEPEKWVKNGRRGIIMSWISEKITHKECLRYWNRERMSDSEFDEWYDGLGSKLLKSMK